VRSLDATGAIGRRRAQTCIVKGAVALTDRRGNSAVGGHRFEATHALRQVLAEQSPGE